MCAGPSSREQSHVVLDQCSLTCWVDTVVCCSPLLFAASPVCFLVFEISCDTLPVCLTLVCLSLRQLVLSLWFHVGTQAFASKMCNWNVEYVSLESCETWCMAWQVPRSLVMKKTEVLWIIKPILDVDISVVFIYFFFLCCCQVMCIFRCTSWEEMTLPWKLASAFLWSSGFDWISLLRADRYICYWITGSRLRFVYFDYVSDNPLNRWIWKTVICTYIAKERKI